MLLLLGFRGLCPRDNLRVSIQFVELKDDRSNQIGGCCVFIETPDDEVVALGWPLNWHLPRLVYIGRFELLFDGVCFVLAACVLHLEEDISASGHVHLWYVL